MEGKGREKRKKTKDSFTGQLASLRAVSQNLTVACRLDIDLDLFRASYSSLLHVAMRVDAGP